LAAAGAAEAAAGRDEAAPEVAAGRAPAVGAEALAERVAVQGVMADLGWSASPTG